MADLSSLEEYLNREFGPLNIQDPNKRARRILDESPEVDISGMGGSSAAPTTVPDWTPSPSAGPTEDNWDRTRLLGAGVMDLAGMAVGAPEYLARQTGLDVVAGGLQKARGAIGNVREDILSGVDPEYLERVGREVMTLDPTRSLWRSGNPLQIADALYGKVLQSLPSTLAVMLPAARLFSIGATKGALSYLGASEGGLSVGAIQNNIVDEIAGMTNEQLLKESPRYREVYDSVGGNEELARREFTAEAQGIAPLVGGTIVAGISLVTGQLLKPVFTDPGMSLGRRFGTGFLEEFPQEGSQGLSEQVVQNYAAKIYDQQRPLMEGALEAFGQEGLVGGLTGGATTAAFGKRPDKPLPDPLEEPPPYIDPKVGGGPSGPGGGQLNIPGFDTQAANRAEPEPDGQIPTPEEAEAYMQGQAFPSALDSGRLNIPVTEQPDMFDRPGAMRMSDPTMEPIVPRPDDIPPVTPPGPDGRGGPTGGQMDLPLGRRERGRSFRQLTPIPGTDGVPNIPDSMDRPTAEPMGDIKAQIADMNEAGGRVAVYLSPEQGGARGVTRSDLPKGARIIPNWDGKGGALIVKNASAANRAMKLRAQVREGTKTLQEAIGELTLSGRGKPADGRYVVQKLDNRQNVARESMVSTLEEAKALRDKWGANVRITTPDAALRRRESLMEQPLQEERTTATRTKQVPYTTRGGEQRVATVQEEGTETPGLPKLRDIEDEINERRDDEEAERERREFDEAQRKFRFEEGIQEEFDPSITDEDIDNLAEYTVNGVEVYETTDENKTTVLARREVSKPARNREEAYRIQEELLEKNRAKEDEFDIAPADRSPKPVVDLKGTEELDIMFERAVRARGDRKAETFHNKKKTKVSKDEYVPERPGSVKVTVKKGKGKVPPFSVKADVEVDVEKGGSALRLGRTTKQKKSLVDASFDTREEAQKHAKKLREAGRTGVRVVRNKAAYQSVKEKAKEHEKKEGVSRANMRDEKLPSNRLDDEGTEPAAAPTDLQETLTLPESEGTYDTSEQPDEPGNFAQTYEAEAREQYGSTAGKKLKFIYRERGAQKNRQAEVRDIKDTKVAHRPGGKAATKPLTFEAIPAEESRDAKLKRKEKVRKAKENLDSAVKEARRVMGLLGIRLNKTNKVPNFWGDIAGYISKQQRENGSFTEEGRKALLAREYYFDLIELAEALLAIDSESIGYAGTMEQIASSLEAIKGKDAASFTNYFSKLAKQQEKAFRNQARTYGYGGWESIPKRDKAILKQNKKRVADMVQRSAFEALGNDRLFAEWVLPTLRNIAATGMKRVMAGGGTAWYLADTPTSPVEFTYTPTDFEMQKLYAAVRTYRIGPYDKNIFYNPLRKHLQNLGFKFDENGDVAAYEPNYGKAKATGLVQVPTADVRTDYQASATDKFRKDRELPANNDIKEFPESPGRETVGIPMERGIFQSAATSGDTTPPKVPKPTKVPKSMAAENRAEKEALAQQRGKERKRAKPSEPEYRGSRRQEVDERRESGEKVQAVANIRKANALIQRFKERVLNSKATIGTIKTEEMRMIRGLRKLGIWRDTAAGMGVIEIGGYKSKTYRLVGPRLENKTLVKGKPDDQGSAKWLVNRIANIPVPRELLPVARKFDEVRPGEVSGAETVEDFLNENDEYLNINDFYLEAIDIDTNSVALDTAAGQVGDIIRDPNSQATIGDVLDAIIENLPPNHFYRRVAEKLKSLNMSDVTLEYDWKGAKFRGKKKNNMGVYDPTTNRIYLNRNRMVDEFDSMIGVQAVHTMLHETLHAATHYAIANNPQLKAEFTRIRDVAYNAWVARRGEKSLPVGLRRFNSEGKPYPIDEFVVEVFADETLMEFLDTVPNVVEDTPGFFGSIGQWLRKLIHRIMGTQQTPESDTLLQAFMQQESTVFSGAGLKKEGAEVLNLEAVDGFTSKVTSAVMDRVDQRQAIWQRVRERAATGGRFTRAAMNLMTMEQFGRTFSKYFPKGTLDRYIDVFSRRNAAAAKRMQLPTRISSAWTAIEENDAKNGTVESLEISRIGTTATLKGIVADKPLNSPENEHLQGKTELEKLHKDLFTRFNKLSDAAKKVYRDARQYYSDTADEQQAHLLQSALRAVMVRAEGAILDIDSFNKKFSIDNIKAIKSREDLTKLLEEYVSDDDMAGVLEQLYRMSNIGKQNRGDYFPSMRYGEYVTYAEKEHPPEFFDTREEAMGRRAELAKEDPTLDVHAYLNKEEDKWQVVVKEREFVQRESVEEAEKENARLRKEYAGGEVSDVNMLTTKQREAVIKSNDALWRIIQALDGEPAAQAAIKAFYIRSLAENSFRKHEAKRKNRRGVDYDLQHRNLATYAKQASYYTSQLEYGWQMAEALREMDKFTKRRQAKPGEANTLDLSRVVDHLGKRDQLGADLPDINELVRLGVEGTHFFMLTSPSYWAINATQPWMISLPQMAAKFGYRDTISAMGRAQRLIKPTLLGQAAKSKGGLAAFGNRVLKEQTFNIIDQLIESIEKNAPGAAGKEYAALIDELRNRHIIDINVFTEMRERASGKSESTWTRVVDASRVMAHLTEVNNRVLVALAAYDLATQNPDLLQGQDKVEYVADIVSSTQFNYSSQNKPPLFQAGGPLGAYAPLMFQFMQWPQHMYALLIRNFANLVAEDKMTRKEARRAVGGLLATHAAVGGMTGMMLQPIKWAFGFMMMAFGDDDEPWTAAAAMSGEAFDRWISELAADLFGSTASTVISKGLPAGLGLDLSARMSMGTFYFIDLRGDRPEDVLGSLVSSFGGATLNQVMKLLKGAGYAMDGDFYKGLETASPKMARDMLRAVRYYNEGLVNNAGDTMIRADDLNMLQVMSQFFGFTPTEISNTYDAQAAIKAAEQYSIGRRSALMKDYRNAESSAERSQIRSDIREFNRNNPAERITASALLQNIRAQRKRERRIQRFGANIDERTARYYRDYGDQYL